MQADGMKAHCAHCKSLTTMVDPVVAKREFEQRKRKRQIKDGVDNEIRKFSTERWLAQGKCVVCGFKISRFVKSVKELISEAVQDAVDAKNAVEAAPAN